MERPYSFGADWLSKFHTASEPIQALWIVALTIVPLGMTWLMVRGLRDLVSLLTRREPATARPGSALPRRIERKALQIWREPGA